MEKLLISSCLAGCKVRYNGTAIGLNDSDSQWLSENFEIIKFCPEVSAGLETPRPSAEIQKGSGFDVLEGNTKVLGVDGADVTKEFKEGAYLTLKLCKKEGIKNVLLTDGSPSCGSVKIYTGNFDGTKRSGKGVTAALLEKNGIRIFDHNNIEKLKNETKQTANKVL